jgi:hypothetical protein
MLPEDGPDTWRSNPYRQAYAAFRDANLPLRTDPLPDAVPEIPAGPGEAPE